MPSYQTQADDGLEEVNKSINIDLPQILRTPRITSFGIQVLHQRGRWLSVDWWLESEWPLSILEKQLTIRKENDWRGEEDVDNDEPISGMRKITGAKSLVQVCLAMGYEVGSGNGGLNSAAAKYTPFLEQNFPHCHPVPPSPDPITLFLWPNLPPLPVYQGWWAFSCPRCAWGCSSFTASELVAHGCAHSQQAIHKGHQACPAIWTLVLVAALATKVRLCLSL